MGKGFIKLHREITDSWLWKDKPFSYGQAWIDLLLMSQWKDGKEIYNHKLMERKAGTVYVSKKWLADRWGWSVKKVTTFIGNLIGDQMVVAESTTQGTTLTIVNWAKWQGLGLTEVQTKDIAEETPGKSAGKAQENTKEGKERKSIINNYKEKAPDAIKHPEWM